MKVFVSLISLSSQNTVSRKERQAETVTEISPLFTENIDLFLESSSTNSWLDDLAVFDTTPDFSLLGEVFDTTTGVFSFIIPTTAPAFEIPSTTQSSAELVNFTTDIGKLLLENTPWSELQTTTESLDDLLAELSTDSPFDLISGTELPADLLDLIMGTTQSPLIDLFTVPDDIELPVATTVDTLIEDESTVAATSSTPITPAPVSTNETTKVSTTASTTPATSKSAATTSKSAATSSTVGSTSTVSATEAPAVSEGTPAAEETEPETAVTEAAIASSSISNTSSASTNESTTAVPSTTAPEPEPEPGNTTTPDSTTARPDTTTPAATDTTTSSASQVMLSAFVIFILALFQ